MQYGVFPILAPDVTSTDDMPRLSDSLLLGGGELRDGDSIVFVAGQPIGRPGTTNLMKLALASSPDTQALVKRLLFPSMRDICV